MQRGLFSGLLNLAHIRGLAKHMLDEFTAALPLEWTELQPLRALSVLWICVFVPEAVYSPLVRQMKQLVETSGPEQWITVAPLRAALFALTKEEHWIRPLYDRITTGGHTVRGAAIDPLALVAPLLDFRLNALTNPILNNFLGSRAWTYESVLLLAAWQGQSPEKAEVFDRIHRALPELLMRRDDLTAFFDGFGVENSHFCDLFRDISDFIALESMSLGIAPIASTRDSTIYLSVANIVERIRNHPLTGALVRLHRD